MTPERREILRHMAASRPRCKPQSAAAVGRAVGMKPTDAAGHLCGLMTQGLVQLATRGSGWVLTRQGIDHAETRMTP
jgi:predicted ArsR family transcriptional regulator